MKKTIIIPGKLPLTDKQVKILRFLAAGLSNEAMAESAGIKIKTVHAHKENIKHLLGCANHRELTIAAVKWVDGK